MARNYNSNIYMEQGGKRLILQSDNSAAPAATTLYIGGGTSAAPVTTATADTKFIEFRFENTATSGDNRGIYNRFYLSGAGGGGESLRSFTTVNNVAAGTAHGAHLSLNFGTSGSVTGLGCGSRSTLHGVNAAVSGTVCGAQSELYADGASTDYSGATHSIHRFVNDGNATGKATLDNVLEFVGMNSTSFKTGSIGGTTKGLRVLVDGTVYYIAAGTTCS